MKLEDYITPEEEEHRDYLMDRYRRLLTDKAYADLCRYMDSLYRKYPEAVAAYRREIK